MTGNDPEMGGVSISSLIVNADRLAWEGDVKIVPSLDAPGFCLACVIMMIGANSILPCERMSASKRLTHRETPKIIPPSPLPRDARHPRRWADRDETKKRGSPRAGCSSFFQKEEKERKEELRRRGP